MIPFTRSKDGLHLWACSSDGQAAVASFSLAEFPPLVPETFRRSILAAHGFIPRMLAAAPRAISSQNSMVDGAGTAAQPNKLVARKTKRPRTVPLQPQPQPQPPSLAAPAPQSSTSAAAFASAPTVNGPAFSNVFASSSDHFNGAAARPPHHSTLSDPSFPRKRKASALPLQIDESSVYSAVGPWVPSNELQPGYGAPRLSDRDYRLVGHTLGGSRESDEERPEPVVLVPSYCLRDREVTFRVSNRVPDGEVAKKGSERVLQVPEILSEGKLKVEDSDAKDTFEWRNFDQGERE